MSQQARMYWESISDTHNEAISNAMTRNRFDEIIKYIYMYDPDSAETNDKCGKIRSIMDIINDRFLKYCPSEKIGDVDEAMIPYYGTYGCGIRQAMRQKPIRFWCLNYPDGYLIAFDVYQGAKGRPNPHKEKFGVEGGSVLALVDRLPEDHKLHLFLDNYFTSPALYDELSRRGFLVTGTFRKDRIGHCPLPKLNKSPRGTMSSYHTKEAGGMVLVKWNDNGEIFVGSNCIGADPVGKVKRWSSVEKKKVDVDAPAAILLYNIDMGGTDVQDHAFSCNRPSIRSKKCWFPLASFMVISSMHNAYQIYRRTATRDNTSF